MKFNWHLGPRNRAYVEKIVDRAFTLCAENGIPTGEKINLQMDLVACHNHGCRINFRKLLNAPDFDFLHDILGIGHHLNRETGQLEDFFLPRCATA
jgi:hypothetical protein